MAHLTAGDITPIGHILETTYGTTPVGTLTYYGDIREGGNITPTDNPNPYLNWRYAANGKRTYDANDYVNQQKDAGFNTAIECRDQAGWSDILKYAGISASSTPLASIPSRSVQFGFKQDDGSTQYALTYRGCVTDQLRISADVPGGIVAFDETVLAALRDTSENTFITSIAQTDKRAVQWYGGVTLGGNTIYPQSFSITIKNNLARARAYISGLGSKTVAMVAGRQEIEVELTLWMEDFTELLYSMENISGYRIMNMTLGKSEEITLSAYCNPMADGTNQALVQDKQTQTVRLRAYDLYYTISA